MEYCLSVTYIAMELLAFVLVLDTLFKRRWNGGKFWIAFLAVAAVQFILLNYLHFYVGSLQVVYAIASYLIYFAFLYKQTNKPLLVVSTVAIYAASYYLSLAVYALSALFLHSSIQEIRETYLPLIIISMLAHSAIVSAAAIVKQLRPFSSHRHINWRYLLLSQIFPLSSLFTLLTLLVFTAQTGLENGFIAFASVFLTLANSCVLLLLDWMEKAEMVRERELALTQKTQLQAQNMLALSNAYAKQRKITHDFCAQLNTLNGLLQEGKTESAKQYLQEAQKQQSTRTLLVNSHNAILDALLNEKAYEAIERGIEIHFEVNDLGKLQMNPIDITVLLANLLDNAIEACVSYEGQKQIDVKVLLSTTLFFSISNTTRPVKIINDSIETSKEEPYLHGFGLKNVKMILEKYHSEHAMKYENGRFYYAGEIDDLPVS